jgi:hypothetical protein
MWRVVGATIVLCAGLGADSTVKSTVVAAQPAGQWKDIHFLSGRLGGERSHASCDFNHRLKFDFEGFDLSVELNRIAFTLPLVNYPFRSCPLDRREITIRRIGFSRGIRTANLGVGGGDLASATVVGVVNLFRAKTVTRYFLSLDYIEPEGDEASATFYFEGQDPTALLTSLSRISKIPVDVPESEPARLGPSVNVSVSFDPHRQLLANVPIWKSEALTLEGRPWSASTKPTSISQIARDGSIALADHALWELQTGKFRRRLADPPRRRNTWGELIAGEGRWLLWAGNSGAINGKNAMRAGEVTITDTTAAAAVDRVGPLPYILDVLLVPDATLALAVALTPYAQGRVGLGVSAIALGRGEVIWRAPVPASLSDRPRIGRSDAARVLAFGRDWIRLWNGATGESLFDSIAFLRQAEPAFIAIRDAALVKDRIILVYATKAGIQIASIAMNSGRVLNHTQLSASIGGPFHTWWSPARNVLLMVSQDRLSLWDTDTLGLIGDLNIPLARGRLFAEFDASGELLATMHTSEGLDRHVVFTDVRTRTPVGQCLLGDAEAMQLASDGRTVLGYQGNRLLFCKRGG